MLFERNELRFDNIICLNSKITKKINKVKYSNKILAADGGFFRLLKLNIIADIVIGDFDSIENIEEINYNKTTFIKDNDQETNDFEKVLNYCVQNNLNNILVLGINGGQLEHTLNNISILKKFSKKLNLFFYDKKRLGFIIDKNIEVKSKINELISIIPISKADLLTKNLKWNLLNDFLEIGVREGARNRSIGDNFEINVINGQIILFIDYDL